MTPPTITTMTATTTATSRRPKELHRKTKKLRALWRSDVRICVPDRCSPGRRPPHSTRSSVPSFSKTAGVSVFKGVGAVQIAVSPVGPPDVFERPRCGKSPFIGRHMSTFDASHHRAQSNPSLFSLFPTRRGCSGRARRLPCLGPVPPPQVGRRTSEVETRRCGWRLRRRFPRRRRFRRQEEETHAQEGGQKEDLREGENNPKEKEEVLPAPAVPPEVPAATPNDSHCRPSVDQSTTPADKPIHCPQVSPPRIKPSKNSTRFVATLSQHNA